MPPMYYQVLQILPDAAPAEVEAAYRRLARQYHPDLNKAPDATGRMQALNEAYAVLRDPRKRAAYDRMRAAVPAPRQRPAPAPPPAEPPPPPRKNFEHELELANIRARLLELNGPDQPYTVAAAGRRLIGAPKNATGYRLEMLFNAEHRTARLVEVNAARALPRLIRDVRRVLAAHGWHEAS